MKKTLIQKLDQIREDMENDDVGDFYALRHRFRELLNAMIAEIEEAEAESNRP